MTDNRAPENWEAGDHIENLKRGLGQKGLCVYHDDSTRSQIWIIHHVDLLERHIFRPAKSAGDTSNFNWLGTFKVGKYGVTGLAAIVLVCCIGIAIILYAQIRALKSSMRTSSEQVVKAVNQEARVVANELKIEEGNKPR